MANYKVNLFFQQAGVFGTAAQGWSETYYTQASSPDVAYNQMVPFITDRCSLLAQPAEFQAVRISDVAIKRDSGLFPVFGVPSFNPDYQADTAWNAALIHMTSGSIYWRQLYLRGIPDGVFAYGDAGDFGTAQEEWLAAWNIVRDKINSLQYPLFLYAIDRVANPQRQILGIAVDDTLPNYLRVTTSVAHGFVDGDEVAFYNTQTIPPLGHKIVRLTTPPIANVFLVAATNSLPTIQPAGSAVMKITKDFKRIDYATFERVVHRIVGRPFGQQRGRRANRR